MNVTRHITQDLAFRRILAGKIPLPGMISISIAQGVVISSFHQIASRQSGKAMRILITGGAGFIGANAAQFFAYQGKQIRLFDNLSRAGARNNSAWLEKIDNVDLTVGDLRDMESLRACFEEFKPEVVLHLGAQVAVTTSVMDPMEDFEINARGTLNVLECARRLETQPIVIFSSTNKVYGGLEELTVVEHEDRFAFDHGVEAVNETMPLDFHSPYGCSKGVADQYCLDYARIYGLKTVVFRQSCIFGTHQYGIEDQGWVAWFLIAAITGKPITIFGSGKQVRDVLHVNDLARAFDLAIANIDNVAGKAFNLGGGPANTLSLLELMDFIHRQVNQNVAANWSDFRPGDQMIYVSDISKFSALTGWTPQVSLEEGLQQLTDWIRSNQAIFSELN